jgi:uncharacterized protein YbjT (DUF2867 family)
METPPADRPTVVIAGATGFVGTALRRLLQPTHDLVALTRSPVRARFNHTASDHEQWRYCDLFSAKAVEEGLAGADYAIYLVHSMLPSSRLTQADPVDLDLLLADNFARAAERQGVKQILYVGGLVPTDADGVPEPLTQRQEVEQTLGSTSVPLTALRAGIIVGPGGSWLRTVLRLVRRLPAMVLPAWTEAMTQPIAIADVTRALKHCLGNPATYDQAYDLGGPERMTYRNLLERTARVVDKDLPMATVPVEAPGLSRLWVKLFTGAPWPLVGPLIETLRRDVQVRPNPLQDWLAPSLTPFDDALRRSLDAHGRPLPNPRAALRGHDDAVIRELSVARSVQRLPLPPGFSARDVADEYMRWLPRFGWPFLKCTVSDDRVCRFYLRPLKWPLLELTFAADRSADGRQLFYVTGGLLADPGGELDGRLEFRRALNGTCVLAAVHDFAPRLPWIVYNSTQALAHLVVMNGFGRHLRKLADRRAETPADAPDRAPSPTTPVLSS